MSQPRKRQPRELLKSITSMCAREHMSEEAGSPWGIAAFHAYDSDACPLLAAMPFEPAKRSYYGAKGSLRNPFRA